jgi:transposase
LDVRAFLQALLRHLRGTVVLLWDRGTIHTRREVRAYLATQARVSPYNFPPDAPELNPAEQIWNRADAAPANGAPQDVEQLRGRLHQAIRKLRGSPQRLWSCLYASQLPWER